VGHKNILHPAAGISYLHHW